MRLTRKRLKKCTLTEKILEKDENGYESEKFSQPKEIYAEIFPAFNKLQNELYGQKINEMMNMLYDGDEVISEGNYISDGEKNYKVISVKKYTNHSFMELERVDDIGGTKY